MKAIILARVSTEERMKKEQSNPPSDGRFKFIFLQKEQPQKWLLNSSGVSVTNYNNPH